MRNVTSNNMDGLPRMITMIAGVLSRLQVPAMLAWTCFLRSFRTGRSPTTSSGRSSRSSFHSFPRLFGERRTSTRKWLGPRPQLPGGKYALPPLTTTMGWRSPPEVCTWTRCSTKVSFPTWVTAIMDRGRNTEWRNAFLNFLFGVNSKLIFLGFLRYFVVWDIFENSTTYMTRTSTW